MAPSARRERYLLTCHDVGGETTCAVLDTGGAQCWGSNEFGQLGDGTYRDSSKPVAVVGLSFKVVSIAAGGYHTCALLEVTGGVQWWGSNRYGQIGDGTIIDSPVARYHSIFSGVISIAAGAAHTCAVLDTGGAQCWGSNSDGQLGDATLTDSSAPVGVSGLSAGVVSIAASGSHTCALMSSGGVQCWGILLHEETSGNGDVSSSTPESVPGLSFGVVAIASNGACALMSSGGVQCWGEPINDLDGDKHGGPPVDVSGLSAGVVSIAAGGSHACAVLDTGSVQCWGSNEYGQIGDGVPKTRNTPVVVAKPR